MQRRPWRSCAPFSSPPSFNCGISVISRRRTIAEVERAPQPEVLEPIPRREIRPGDDVIVCGPRTPLRAETRRVLSTSPRGCVVFLWVKLEEVLTAKVRVRCTALRGYTSDDVWGKTEQGLSLWWNCSNAAWHNWNRLVFARLEDGGAGGDITSSRLPTGLTVQQPLRRAGAERRSHRKYSEIVSTVRLFCLKREMFFKTLPLIPKILSVRPSMHLVLNLARKVTSPDIA